MTRNCTQCNGTFEVTKDDLAFYDKVSPIIGGVKLQIPPPTLCPDCRFMRRLTERNARNLYKRTCDLTGKKFISPYHSHHPFPVYHPDIWWSDQWDELQYGRDVDFSRPFFPQFKELLESVPHQGQFVIGGTMENSDYVNCAGNLKDCYLITETDHNEHCYYGNRLFFNTYMIDCSNCYESELCYECIDCIKCYNLRFSEDCQGCSESSFLKNCISCRDCIGCINQRQKQYMILNRQCSREQYEGEKQALKLNTQQGIEAIRAKADAFCLTQPQKAVQTEHNQNCTGNHLYDSKNSFECFDCKDLEDCTRCARVFGVKSSMDYTSWGDQSELMYQCAACGDHAYNLKFCTTCTTNNADLEYCAHCTGCRHCFGCVGMRRKEYCIFNTQYEKSEFERLRETLIAHMQETGEWGEFFPKDMSPFGYNETIAMEYFPLTKVEACGRGYKWHEEERDLPDAPRVIAAEQLPQTVAEVPDAVLDWAVLCMATHRPFRITKQELRMYRRFDLPIPRCHPDERHRHRMLRRPNITLVDRTCTKCKRAIRTSYAPDRPEIVYCERCYLETVY